VRASRRSIFTSSSIQLLASSCSQAPVKHMGGGSIINMIRPRTSLLRRGPPFTPHKSPSTNHGVFARNLAPGNRVNACPGSEISTEAPKATLNDLRGWSRKLPRPNRTTATSPPLRCPGLEDSGWLTGELSCQRSLRYPLWQNVVLPRQSARSPSALAS